MICLPVGFDTNATFQGLIFPTSFLEDFPFFACFNKLGKDVFIVTIAIYFPKERPSQRCLDFLILCPMMILGLSLSIFKFCFSIIASIDTRVRIHKISTRRGKR